MSRTLKAHIALLAANLIYGINYTVAKDVMPDYVGPYGLVLLRIIGAGLLFWLVFGLVKKGEQIEKKDWLRLAGCALFGVATNQLFFLSGLNLTTPINAAIIMTSNPIVVLIIAAIFLKERITLMKVLGIIVGIGGAATLFLMKGDLTLGEDTRMGDLLILLNSTSYAIYLVMAKPLLRKYKATTVMKWVFTLGLGFVLLYPGNLFDLTPGTSVNELIAVDWAAMPTGILLTVIYVVIFVTFFAYLLNVYALKAVNPSVVSTYIYLQPVLAAGVALTLGKDSLDWVKVLSTVLIFLGVWMVSRK